MARSNNAALAVGLTTVGIGLGVGAYIWHKRARLR